MMLRVTSKRSLSTFQTVDAKLGDYFKYHATNASLKPLIYRPKNTNMLLAMDLKDPETNIPLKPREPIKPLSKSVLNTYIWSAQDAAQLMHLLKTWTSITTRKRGIWGYFTAEHIQNILIASMFKMGKFSFFVRKFYDLKPQFIEAKNDRIYDVEHFFNTLVMCQLHRNAIRNLSDENVAQKKLVNAWRHVSVRENTSGLANLLVAALQKQQGIGELTLDGLAPTAVKLPFISADSVGNGKLAAYLSRNRFTYLMARTIVEFGEPNEEVSKFVENYKLICSKLNKPDTYEEYVSNAKELLKEPIPSDDVGEHPLADQS